MSRRSEQRKQERKHKAQLARIAKADSQASILKWIERAIDKPYRGRVLYPVLSWGNVRPCLGKMALAGGNNYRMHLVWAGIDGLPDWVRFDHSGERSES